MVAELYTERKVYFLNANGIVKEFAIFKSLQKLL